MRTLELASGEFLEVTPEHRFYSNDEWITAEDLHAGDILRTKSGDYTTILGIDTLFKYEKVYNFDVEDNENYYVTEEGLLVHNGRYRAIDKGADYENQIRGLYDDLKPRSFETIVDGIPQNRVADAVTEIGDDLVAVEAKFVDDWATSIRNPDYVATLPFPTNAVDEILNQARDYSRSFDRIIYHSNSQDLINHYSQVFQQNGLNNIEWVLTPFK